MFFDFLVRVPPGLGGDLDILAPALHHSADALLAGGIDVGGVEEIEPEVEASPDDVHGVFIRKPLDGDTPESYLRYHQIGLAESYLLHALSFQQESAGALASMRAFSTW